MAGLCEGGNEPSGSLKAIFLKRWGSWLEACNNYYYAHHLQSVKKVVQSFDTDDAAAIQIRQELLNDRTIEKEVMDIKSIFLYLRDAIIRLVYLSRTWRKATKEREPKEKDSIRCGGLNFGVAQCKVMLEVFFDSQGLMHHEFIPEGRTVTKELYVETLRRLWDAVRRKRPEKWVENNWFLMHDNAPAHRAIIVKNFLARHNITALDHPPYSPDLSPPDYFLFPRLKSHLK
ncbi:hypothetical protein ANN_16912 [Periplaneta americana]|uniref:Mariner Mos1 transposase n=1 Tax=Periplaneta americana TaxID=6978 RepID=A0ABQ8SRF5_PERAM|nr:hypothetical protein ANN_16912 [Periplaneta americana]